MTRSLLAGIVGLWAMAGLASAPAAAGGCCDCDYGYGYHGYGPGYPHHHYYYEPRVAYYHYPPAAVYYAPPPRVHAHIHVSRGPAWLVHHHHPRHWRHHRW
jgi:hypothetical protein